MRPQPRPEQPIPSALAPALLRPPCAADTFIQRTKKLYVDTRTQRNLNKLNDVRRARRCAAARATAPVRRRRRRRLLARRT